MNTERLRQFAEQLEADTDDILDRWQGRPDHIIDDIFRIRDEDTGQLRDLELFDVQRELVHAYFYGDAGALVAYKGRRIGYSFAVVACFLIEGMFYPDSYYPLVSRSLSQSKARISDIDDLIENAKIEIPTQKSNTDYIKLWNDTAFEAFSSDSDTSRGRDSARAVLMDEMAFMDNQERAHRAFGAFLALGENRKMVEVSTPNTENDLFMQEYRRGADGDDSVISIKQPTFANADEVDVYTPLEEQELEPVRPELNISQLESQRMRDPEGFAQEYLCQPVSDEYRFFDPDTIERAQDRATSADYDTGLSASKPHGARRIMGVDIGINRDDTVLSVTDHHKGERKQRELVIADEDVLGNIGIRNPDRANANHIAKLIAHVHNKMDVDLVIMDRGGVGQTFDRIVERKLGRGVVGFDFSDKESVSEMMGDMNMGLHEDKVTLVDEYRLQNEMEAIVKEKRDEYQRPKFTGKEYSESGKDDAAIATILSCYPPNHSVDPAREPSVKEPEVESSGGGAAAQKEQKENGEYNPSYSATSVQRTTRTRRNRYQSRKSRSK